MREDEDALPTQLRSIEELEQSLRTDAAADLYYEESGVYPFNVSLWNPSDDFRDKMIPRLRFGHELDPLSYIFSELVESREAILSKLGFDPATKECIITPNGTISMLCAINWIASAGLSDVAMLCPVYFAALHQARLLNLRVQKRFMSRRDGAYHLPDDVAGPEQRSIPLWVTNPVYCTGVELAEQDVQKLLGFLDAGGIVILDECVAPPGAELGPRLARHHKGFIGIYSPHKGVAMNGVKFSVVVFDRSYLQFFQSWTDVIHGGLTPTATLAVKHFLSENFTEYRRAFQSEAAEALRFVRRVAGEHAGAELDRDVTGQFATIYLPGLPADFDAGPQFYDVLMRRTGGTLIPGRRSHFDPAIGGCFRVNLARDGARFRATLTRLLRCLTSAEAKDQFSSSERE